MRKLLIIVGPTSSGKSELAVRLAKKFKGEIISCDSRQIYRGMDLGTGKVPGKWEQYSPPSISNTRNKGGVPRTAGGGGMYFFYKKIRHSLIDFVNPKRQYSAALFQARAQKAIADILARGKLPILCGGTAHWIDAVVYDQQLPDVKPNPRLRSKLEKQSASALYRRLMNLDPRRAKTIDRHNKRRLIRALEIVIATGKPVPNALSSQLSANSYNALWIGINPPQAILYATIKTRLTQRLRAGMLKEVARLHDQGLSWQRLKSFGLEYKFCALYLQKKIAYDEMFSQLLFAIKHYSKRQMTWWKRNKDINWFEDAANAERFVKISSKKTQ